MASNVVFLGAPGAGKGTQAKILQERYGYDQLSTGEILRDNANHGTALGLEAQSYMSRGELVPDRLIIDMVRQTLPEHTRPMIFDGFPRTIPQARALDEMLKSLRRDVPVAVCFRIDLLEAKRRLVGRGRDDDDDATVQHRFDVFERHRQELERYYNTKPSSRFREIDASQPMERVTRDLLSILEIGTPSVMP
jgi:adenylate kinase